MVLCGQPIGPLTQRERPLQISGPDKDKPKKAFSLFLLIF